MRLALSGILVLVGMACLWLSGLEFWQCFFVADGDLSDAGILNRQAEKDVRQQANLRREALERLKSSPPSKLEERLKEQSPEQVLADLKEDAKAIQEGQQFLKQRDEIMKRKDQDVKDKAKMWRFWHFVRGTVRMLLGFGLITAGLVRPKSLGG